MGRFVNPDNSAFQIALNSKIYIDKTLLLDYTNQVMDTDQSLICNSRPRRFGKSFTANMLTAYYSKGCHSERMFDTLAISKTEAFHQHLNQYDVIQFDVQWCCMDAGSAEATVSYINSHVLAELKALYPGQIPSSVTTVYGAMSCIHAACGSKFIVIIDEWDALIRDEAANSSVLDEYIHFLRGMFKGSEPTKFLHLAFLTGILPIKKLKTQSALNNFDEFTMLDAGLLAPYIGFTDDEVHQLCDQYHQNFNDVKRWYNGYRLDGYEIYNPKAVVNLLLRKKFQSYWSQTGTYEMILPLINMNFDGLKTSLIAMLAGDYVKVKTSTYQNDMVSFRNKDDVLTLLIHLGYLAYDSDYGTAFIPNEEIRSELLSAIEEEQWDEFWDFQQKSSALLHATLDYDTATVAKLIENIHSDYASAIMYNNENSLSSVLSIAYLAAMHYYFKPIREMPAGKGFADLVFIPKKQYQEMPAFIIELKWNHSAQTALQQIKDKNYSQVFQDYTGDILLVGISYDKKTKKHECVIEKETK